MVVLRCLVDTPNGVDGLLWKDSLIFTMLLE